MQETEKGSESETLMGKKYARNRKKFLNPKHGWARNMKETKKIQNPKHEWARNMKETEFFQNPKHGWARNIKETERKCSES